MNTRKHFVHDQIRHEESRSINSKKNIIYAICNNALTFIASFIVRTVLIYTLGEKYLGLTSVYTSIVSALNVAELGFASAIVVNMYEPIAKKNTIQVNKLLEYYKRIYRIIGIIVVIIGIIISPFLDIIVGTNAIPGENILLIYFLYILEASSSYFLFSYRTSLLTATQHNRIVKNINSFTILLRTVLQIIAIIIFKSIYLYAFTLFICVIADNILAYLFSKKMYPEYRCEGELDKVDRQQIKTQVKGLLIVKIGQVSRNSLDNIILSAYLGLTQVAIYGNYYTIYKSVVAALWAITAGIQASVANSIVTESEQKNYKDMRKFEFIFNWLITWCTALLICLFQPFMKLWVGSGLLLSEFNMILFCVYFYSISIISIRNMYFEGKGLWWEGKRISILEAVGNLILNIVLGKFFGISGILVATILTILVFNYIGNTKVLFNSYFHVSPKEYYLDRLLYTWVAFILCFISYEICLVFQNDSIYALITRIIVSSLIINIGMCMAYFKNSMFKESIIFIKKLIRVRR